MKKFFDWKLLILPVLAVVMTMIAWPSLPEIIPTHFNVQGIADNTGPKASIWIFPAALFLIPAIMAISPKIDPRRHNYVKFKKSYGVIMAVTEIFLFLMYGWVLGQIYGISAVSGEYLPPVMTGLLFLILGNVMPKIKQNYLVGVKTIWSYDYPDNWNKTQRFGGYCFCLVGVLLLLSCFVPLAMRAAVILSLILIAALLPLGYSWLLFRKKDKENKHAGN